MENMTTESCPKLREETSNSCHVSRQACYHVRQWSCQGWMRAGCLEEGHCRGRGRESTLRRNGKCFKVYCAKKKKKKKVLGTMIFLARNLERYQVLVKGPVHGTNLPGICSHGAGPLQWLSITPSTP